jgi:hypothetical protein
MSTNGGKTWTKKRLTWNYISITPAISVDSYSYIHVIYSASIAGNYEIYHKKSTDGGATWITKRLTWNSGWSMFPDISADFKNLIHALWCDNTPGVNEIFYKKGIQ